MLVVVNGNFTDVKIMIDTCMVRMGTAMHKPYRLFHFSRSASLFTEKHSAFMRDAQGTKVVNLTEMKSRE